MGGWRPDVNNVRPLRLWTLRNRPGQGNRSQDVASMSHGVAGERLRIVDHAAL
jgi:hypothetical protein